MAGNAQLHMFATNIAFLIGFLFCAGVFFILAIVGWTGMKMAICTSQRIKAERAWKIASRRADGQRYPASIEGTCDQCRRGNRTIYYPQEDNIGLCPACYEVFWREQQGLDVSGFAPMTHAETSDSLDSTVAVAG